MPDACRLPSDAVRKLIFASVPTLSKTELDTVMGLIKTLCHAGPFYAASLNKKLRALEREGKISSIDRHAIIESLFGE